MTARLIDGKAAAAALRGRVGAGVDKFREATGRVPGLAVVLVGEDPASAVYVRSKGKATIEAGMLSFEVRPKTSWWRWSTRSMPIVRSMAYWSNYPFRRRSTKL